MHILLACRAGHKESLEKQNAENSTFEEVTAEIPYTKEGGVFSVNCAINDLPLNFIFDTGASLRGIEIEADVMLKGTRVDGVYTADPEKDSTATKFSEITYSEVISRGLKVMDITATAMCMQNNLPIYVFNMDVYGSLKRVILGDDIGTLIHN